MLPILHLNGYKIANPTILARIPRDELQQLLTRYGWEPFFVEGDDPAPMHELMATTLDRVMRRILDIQKIARESGIAARPRWPMIVLATPKGWTGPKVSMDNPVEGTFRAHQVPLIDPPKTNPAHLEMLEAVDEELSARGALRRRRRVEAKLAAISRRSGPRRMGANPHANGGMLLRDLRLPDFRTYAVPVPAPGAGGGGGHAGARPLPPRRGRRATRTARKLPDLSARRNRVEPAGRGVRSRRPASGRAEVQKDDQWLAPDGRVLEMLSEHQCQGWLEGYLLTGRHGLFNTYEAFAHIVDSMFNQHAKWLKVTRGLPWRRPIASLNYLLSSHVWRQDHNGFTHQDPGSSITRSTRRRRSSACICRPTPTAC